jgi:hypothetical protein
MEPVTGVRHVVPGPYGPTMNAAGQPHHSRMHEYDRAVRTYVLFFDLCFIALHMLARALRSVFRFRPAARRSHGTARPRYDWGWGALLPWLLRARTAANVALPKAMRRRLGKGHRVE